MMMVNMSNGSAVIDSTEMDHAIASQGSESS
jgi:hypothetical protein